MKYSPFFLIATIFALLTCCGQVEEAEVGKTLPDWQEGYLDIHFISTVHGECTYQILPDGTTFLTDASGSVTDWGKKLYKPNDSISAGRTIVDYINHFSPDKSKGHINYFLLTHHHGDHMGTVNIDAYHPSGKFKLSSVCEIGSDLVMDKIFDRDWPDFSYPKPAKGAIMDNYKAFLDWTASENGTVIEKWRVGSRTQLVPVNSDAWDVSVRSYAGNGYFWTGGEDEETFTLMPTAEEFATLDSAAIPDENQFSCAYILSYGKFDFFLGGDLMYVSYSNHSDNIEDIPYPYFDAESPMVNAIHKVEVMKANHHGYKGSHSTDFINKLAPEVWLVGAWGGENHPSAGPACRVLAANPKCEAFCTYQGKNTRNDLIEALGEEEVDRRFVSTYGHVVVRVAPGGDSYMVYTLEDSDEEYTVKSIHGPYTCGE